VDDVLYGYEGLQLCNTFESPGYWPAWEATDTQSANPLEYISPCLLTTQEHEHQNYSLSGFSQSIEAFTQDSHSQSLLDFHSCEVQQESSTSGMPQEGQSGRQERFTESPQNFSASVSSCLSPAHSASPASSGLSSSNAPNGKMEIPPANCNTICSTCKKSFLSLLQYKRHMRTLGCQAVFPCHDCGQKFKNKKDLQRHRGHKNATPSCSKLKCKTDAIGLQVKPFVCTSCPKAFTRSDSLIRHLGKHQTCKVCKHPPCKC
jgi:hypothetical protein